MRWVFALVFTLFGLVSPAIASSDARACTSIVNASQRLACFDRAFSSPVSSDSAELFTGWYAGFDLGASQSNDGPTWGWLNQAPRLGGAAVGFFVGHNWTTPSGYVVGLEAQGKHDLGRNVLYIHSTPWQRIESALEDQYSVSLNARFGVPVGRTLLYGRAGVGVASALNDYNNDFFSPPIVHIRDRFTALTVNVGGGAEFHGDRFFGRIEGNVRWAEWSHLNLGAPRLSYGLSAGAGFKFN